MFIRMGGSTTVLTCTNLVRLKDQDSEPTLLHNSTGSETRPDLTLVSADLACNTSFRVLDYIGSGHKPVLVSVDIPPAERNPGAKHRCWVYSKANCQKVGEHLAYERYKRQEETSVLREMVDGWVERKRLSMQSFMHYAVRLSTEIKLPTDRLMLETVSRVPPGETFYMPEVRTTLVETNVGKAKDRRTIHDVAMETIGSYPGDAILAYTVASVTSIDGRTSSPFGVHISSPQTRFVKDHAGLCGSLCAYEAEMTAITEAVDHTGGLIREGTLSATSIVILTDALSVLQAVKVTGESPLLLEAMLMAIEVEQALIAQFHTGHCHIGAYFGRLRPNVDILCRHCREVEETVDHLLFECPGLADHKSPDTKSQPAVSLREFRERERERERET
ncbi:hypothetical protein Btru_061696 [Bulinus truncatus]|nr:hypothetical protein Btru_061696 [Bulinus truncatus]